MTMRRYFFSLLFLSIQLLISQEKSPNIIIMIGDGMGLTQISSGMYANNNKTALEEFEYVGLSKTYALDRLVTDSAASGTAMACGVKTFNGVIGIDGKNRSQPSILELCQEQGYRTGLVVTSSIVHATPASFYAKVRSRSLYNDIALQLSQHNVDLFVGGGKKFFINRKDKRNLVEEMANYNFVKDLQAFENATDDKIGYLTYSEEPPAKMEGRKPALEELTEISLEKMKTKGAPFFMLIEGSQIDWGGHDNNLEYVLSEFKEFDLAIQKVLAYAKADGNTLVIVTADHETGGLALVGGSLKRSNVRGNFTTGGHSATMVPVFSYGPGAEKFSGIYENTAIFDKMLQTLKEND